MANQSDTRQMAVVPEDGWLTLKQAARLCDTTVDALKRLINAGGLRAFTVDRKGKVSFRVSRAALIDAGLLQPASPTGHTATIDLLGLIRDQNQRIARLDDQRAQLAGQLGVALERLRAIDERVSWLEEDPPLADAAQGVPGASATGEPTESGVMVETRSVGILRTSVGRVLGGTVGVRRRLKRGGS